MLGYWKPQTSPRRAPLRPEWIHSLATDSLVHEAGRWRLRGIPRNDFGFKNDPKCHRRPCSLPLADLRPDRFPSGPLLRTASDLNIRTARALGGDHTFLRPMPIYIRSCGSGNAPGPPILSCRRRRMVSPGPGLGSSAGSMDAEARMGRGVSHTHCDARSRQGPLSGCVSQRTSDYVLHPAAYFSSPAKPAETGSRIMALLVLPRHHRQ